MRLICPECKNEVDISTFPNLAVDQVLECDTCGITLVVTDVGEEVSAEIVDEGK
ncbi:MAG TPA: hypothetical protein PK295_01050 [Candidatus Magasanikbacteria bacterium]|nr:hypothetical protein [Candidatus Magasanikbacteria bacterium]